MPSLLCILYLVLCFLTRERNCAATLSIYCLHMKSLDISISNVPAIDAPQTYDLLNLYSIFVDSKWITTYIKFKLNITRLKLMILPFPPQKWGRIEEEKEKNCSVYIKVVINLWTQLEPDFPLLSKVACYILWPFAMVKRITVVVKGIMQSLINLASSIDSFCQRPAFFVRGQLFGQRPNCKWQSRDSRMLQPSYIHASCHTTKFWPCDHGYATIVKRARAGRHFFQCHCIIKPSLNECL